MRSYFKPVIIVALVVWAAAFSPIQAQTGIIGRWITTTGGTTQGTAHSWSSSGNWLGSAVPNSSGDIASIMADIGANMFIKLDGGVTIGTLNLGDLGSTQTYTIGLPGSEILSFDNQTWGGLFNLGGRAALNKVQGGADNIVADVKLVSDLAIYNRVAFTISGSIGDDGNVKSLLKRGTTNLTLTGANSYMGDTIINTTGGTVFLNTTGFNAIVSPLIRLGNSSYDGSVSTAMTLSQSNQIADTSVIQFDGGSGRNAYFRLAGQNETIKGITDYTAQGVIENTGATASTLTLNTDGNDYFYNGYFRDNGAGTLALVKNDAGKLTLSGGTISYSAATSVNGGILNVTNGTAYNSAINLNGGSTGLELTATANWLMRKAVTGSGTVTMTNNSTLTVGLLANNTYTGITSVENGTLQLLAGGRISGTSAIVLDGGALSMVNASNTSLATGTTAANSATVTVGSTAGLVPGMVVSGTGIPGGATISTVNSATQFVISTAATTTGTGLTLSFSAAGANQTDRVPNAVPITMSGGGGGIRFENNGEGGTYTETLGPVTLTGGINTFVAGRTGGNADAAASTLTLSGFTRQLGSTANFLGTGSATPGQILGSGAANRILVTGGLTLNGGGTIGGWATVGNEWATYGANGVTALTSYNTGAFGTWTSISNVKITGANQTLSGGNRTINSLNIQDSAARTLALGGTELTIASGGILASGNNHVLGTNNGLAGVIKVSPGDNELIINVGDANTRTLTVFAGFANFDAGNPLNVVKTGPGKMVMTPNAINNTYSGGTTILGGTIEIKDRANLGTSTDPTFLVMDGGGLELATGSTITIQAVGTRQVTIGPSGGRFELDVGETLNLGDDVASGLGVTGPGRLTIGALDATGGVVNMNGVLSVQGGLTMSAGIFNLNNPANTFSGGINITGGTLVVPSTGSIPDGLNLDMTGGVFQILDGGPGGMVTLGALSGTSGLASITTATTDLNPADPGIPTVLLINQDSNTTFAGDIKDVFGAGNGKSRLSLIKAGSGILSLTSADSFYRGTTTIVGGAISVNYLGLYGDGSGGIGSGDYNDIPNSAMSLLMSAGTSLIYAGTTPSITDRSFTMGTGSEGAAIYANGTIIGASVNFMEYFIGGEQVEFDTPDVGATLTLGGRNTGNNTFGLKLTDNGTGYLSLVKTGPGTWILDNLNNSNSYSGSTTIYDGRLVITGDGALGTRGDSGPPVQLLGGVLDLRNVDYTAVAGETENLLLAGGRLDTSFGTSSWAGAVEIVANSVPNINVGRAAQLTLGDITGGGPLDKDNFGTLVLNGVNSYAGTTRIRDGNLVLDYTTTPGDNKLANGATLFFGGGRTGGTLTILGDSGGTDETVLNTSVQRGEHQIVRGDSGTAVIDLRAISVAAGATLDFEEDDLAKTITNNNASLAAGGILGAWATVNHSTWAYKAANNGITGFVRGLADGQYTPNSWLGITTNTDALINFAVPTGSTTNTLRFNQAGQVTLTLSGTNTVNSGGILVTPNVNAVQQINGGVLTAGALGGNELVIQQYSQTSGLVIGSVIANRVAAPASVVGVQKLGPGVVALTGDNTYTGITTIGGGTLLVDSLADGGLPSSIGQATFASGNIVIAGGTLEYAGESTAINRGFTVREFGQLNVGNEDMTLTLMGDALTAGMGNVVGESGTAEWTKTGAGTLRLVRLEASGGASGIQTLFVSDGKLVLEQGYSTTPSTPAVPAPPNANDRLINLNANLTVNGGTLEYIGDDYVFSNGISLQRFLGLFTVGTGASEIKVTSQLGLNPLAIQRTDLRIGDPNNAQDILREVGGTVLFVENPNGGQVFLNLYTSGENQGKILPWATYQNTANTAQPGVNNFAAIEQTDQTVVSADQKSLYTVKSNPANWTNDGLDHISEEGFTPFGGAPVPTNFQIASLRFFNDKGAGTITLTDSLTLTNGAILVATNVKNNLKTLTGGTLTSTYLPSADQAELMIHNYNPMLAFRLQSVIADPTSLVVPTSLNLTHAGTGTTSLFAANTYTGTTYVTGGVLKLENANALPGGIGAVGGASALVLDGGQIGLTAASGSFTRGLGTGIDQAQFTSSGGFAAYGVDGSVNIGGDGGTPLQVIWGVNGFVPSGDTLILSAADADKTLTFQNPIELGLTDRLVRVENGTAPEDAVLNGALSGLGALIKNGEGALRLAGTNVQLGGVNLAEGTLFVPSPSVLGSGPLNVGTTGNTSLNDAPTLVLEGGAIPNAVTIGNKNSAGITSVEIPNDVTLDGPVTLDKNGVFAGPDSTKVLTVNGAVGGSGGLTLVDGGKIVLSGPNTYGSGGGVAGTAIDGSTIVRNGTLEVLNSTALGDGTKAVELGDAMFTPVNVDRATTGVSLLQFQGSFDPNGDGIPGTVNGIGTFYDVSTTLDGFTYTAGDVGKLILVKDEVENPERNGVYKIFSVGVGGAGTMNLNRVNDGVTFPLAPLYVAYGTDVTIQNGTVNAGKNFFLGSNVDAADINEDGFYWKAEASLNPNVSLLVTAMSSPITNPIDINDTNGTGTTTIGGIATFLHGTAELSGAITLQSQTTDPELRDLILTDDGCAELILSGPITDPGLDDALSLIKTGMGTVTLSGTNSYDGTTTIQGGVLKIDNVLASTLGANNLRISGGVLGLTTASGSFSRALGTGTGQVQWTALKSGGFAAYGTDQSATLSSGAALTWGTTANFVQTGQALILGAVDATAKVTFTNPINLGGATRNFNVPNGPADVEAELSGVISGVALGVLNKSGQGTLRLSGINTFTAGIGLSQGTLQGQRTASGSVFGTSGTSGVFIGTSTSQTGDALKLELLGDTAVSGVTYTVPSTNPITVGAQNATGTSSIDATNGTAAPTVVDVDVLGAVSLLRRTFVGPDANAILKFSGAVSGANGAITVVDGGMLRLSVASSYGSGIAAPSGPTINGSTIIRNGTIEVLVGTALGNGGAATSTVELGDARNNLALVDRASDGTALSDCGAVFSLGTYSGVPTDFGGGNYSAADIGTRLLVKDEGNNPARNGIYQISTVSGGTMTLVRVSDFDQTAEMIYGSTVQVTNGAVPNQQYFLTGSVGTVNTSAVLWRDTVANPNVALLAGAALTIANNIDLNASGSTGTTTLGAVQTLTSGSVTYSGTVTMQSQNAGVENLILDITSSAITSTATGVTFSNVISDGADSLQLRKVGTGVATLTAANTYDGGTLVNEGVLLVNNTTGSGTGTGPVTVTGSLTALGGSVLGGTGTIAGLTTLSATTGNSAILQPGAGVSDANATFDSLTESLAFSGGLTLGAGSTALFQLNGTGKGNGASGYDTVNVTGGTLTFDSTALIQVVLFAGYNPVIGNSFDLFDWVSLPVTDGDLADQLSLPSLSSGVWDTAAFNSSGVISIIVPEPGRFVLVILALGTGILRRRRSLASGR